jgi:tetratricopeptide (TPR) repeat protein
MPSSRLLVIVTIALALGPAVARADVVADAQAHYKLGREHFDAARFEEALVEFERAHALAPRPLLFYHLGRTHRALGNHAQALEHFQKYVTAEPDGKVVDDAKRQIAELAELVVKPTVVEPPPQPPPPRTIGLTLDLAPSSASNKKLDVLDVAPLGLYGAAAAGIVVAVF